MRLTVQSFQRKFDPNDADVKQKMKDYSETLIQQIDTMSAVASAFSNFASMPAQQNETLNVVQVVELAMDIFNEEYIVFESDSPEIISKIDRTQLIRIITNLVKNAIQAIPENQEEKSILVTVKKESDNVLITVADNGIGIKRKISHAYLNLNSLPKAAEWVLVLVLLKTLSKIIRERLPLKLNLEKEPLLRFHYL